MSDRVSEDRVTLTEEGDILLDGDQVGYLGWHENTLVDMIIDKPYRGRGIGTIAIEQMITYMTENDPSIDVIETSVVLSGAMGTALSRVGFEKETVEKPVMSPDTLPKDVDKSKIPTETEIEYKYYISK
jgi:RimJ/RimL family protein N-acetyltransferase